MVEYRGAVFGIGDSQTRSNEVTSSVLAELRDFIIGYNDSLDGTVSGIALDNSHDFYCEIEKNIATISDGLAFAYGYFGFIGKTQFDILPAAVEQYYIVFAEWDNSVIPNTFKIKLKNNQSSPSILDNSFRQDHLSTIKTGIYQMPLWLLKVTNQGVQEKTDLRMAILRECIEDVYMSTETESVYGFLNDQVESVTQDVSDSSDKVATTKFVGWAVRVAIE